MDIRAADYLGQLYRRGRGRDGRCNSPGVGGCGSILLVSEPEESVIDRWRLNGLPAACRTPQITVDDKGLAMIFVFGLPGYRSKKLTMPCLLAGTKVTAMLSGAGVDGTAGVTTGRCFCGLVGDPFIRCEYMVMGGTCLRHER